MTSEYLVGVVVGFVAGVFGAWLAVRSATRQPLRRNWAREYPDPDAANHVARAAHAVHDGRRR
jgi:hypothetical protein